MRSRDFLSVLTVLVAVSATSACSSNKDSSQSMAPQGNDSFSARNNESPPAPLTPSTARLTSETTGAPAVDNSLPPQGSGAPAISSSRTTTAITRRNYPQAAPSSYPNQTVTQSAAAQTNSQYGYAPVNGDANQSSIPYNDARSYNTSPAASAQYPGGGYANADGYGDGDRHVRVNAPLVHVNVDRDNGGVHIDVPFVHINKPSRYESSQVSIPDRGSAAVSQNGY